MAKKRGKTKSTGDKKEKKAQKVKLSYTSDEENMLDSGSSSGASDTTNDDDTSIYEDTKILDFDDTGYNITYIKLKMTLETNTNAIEALRDK